MACTGRRAPVQRSRVGQKLSELTTSRVVVLVLSMLFILPVYNICGGIYGNYPDLGVDGLSVRKPDAAAPPVASIGCNDVNLSRRYFLSFFVWGESISRSSRAWDQAKYSGDPCRPKALLFLFLCSADYEALGLVITGIA